MAALADIFAVCRLALDGTGFEAQAVALADKSGKNVGDRLSKNLNDALKSAGGAAIGAMFGVAVTAGADLDKAMGQLKADTGMVGDEAENAKHALVGMYQGGIQSMDQIGATMAKVRSDLDLTGDAANRTSEKFVKYETATKQTADAVDAVSKVLKAWNLTAGAAGIVMDALVYSHQKYGTNIAENQDMLAKLAPTLTAANMTWKDGLGLLNMFQAAGLDASKATVAMTTALSKVKSPEELQKLMVDISNTEDPFKRAQMAVDLFGKKAGPQMAALLAQGNVAQYTEDVKDYQGATEKAAQAIEDEWGNRAVKAYHEFSGALAEIGSAMGPVMSVARMLPEKMTVAITTGLGALGPKMGAMLAAQFAGDAVQGPVLKGAEGLGRAGGMSFGKAFAGGVAAAGVIAIAYTWMQVNADLSKQADELAEKARVFAKAATAAEIKAARDEANKQKDSLTVGMFGWIFDAKGKINQTIDGLTRGMVDREIEGLSKPELQAKFDDMKAQLGDALKVDPFMQQESTRNLVVGLDEMKTVMATKAAEIVKAGDDAIVAQTQADRDMIDKAAKDGYVGIPTAMQAAQFEASMEYRKGLDDLLSKISNSRSEIMSAATAASDALTRPAEIAREKATLAAEMNSKDLLARIAADGGSTASMKHNLAVEEMAALEAKNFALLAEEATYGTNDQKIAKLNGLLHSQYYLDGLASKDQDTALYWADFGAKTQTQMDALNGIMNTAGTNAGKAWFTALNGQIKDIDISVTSRYSPKARALGGPVEAGMPYLVNENTARSEIFVPQTAGTIVPAGGFGGVVNNFNFPHYVGARGELSKAIAQELRLVGG